MNQQRIGLIVDNPARDLEGLVLVARELARRGHKAYLVPMYSQGFEVPALGLNAVVLNYARKANTRLIQSYHSAGIFVSVLDTEGGVWEHEEQFVKSVNHKECCDFIDLYCFWGTRQKKAFEELTRFDHHKLKTTGCPRYDYYHTSLLPAVQEYESFEKKPILMVSNFALSNPKFGNPETEIQAMMAAGYERDYAELRLADDQKNRQTFKEIIRQLAGDYPDRTIIVRTHPFEDASDYVSEFHDLKNVRLNSHGVVASWLKPAVAAIHCNSSVAIDAYMMKRPMIALGWCTSEITKEMSEISYNLSLPARDYEEVKSIINKALSGDSTSLEGIKKEAKNELDSWFQECDGRAHIRVADALLDTPGGFRAFERARYKTLLRNGSKGPQSKIGRIDYYMRQVIGPARYQKLRERYLNRGAVKKTKMSKRFTAEDIQTILDRVNQAVGDGQKIQARSVSRRDFYFQRMASESIVFE